MTDEELKQFLEEVPEARNFEQFPKVSKFLMKLWKYEKTINNPL